MLLRLVAIATLLFVIVKTTKIGEDQLRYLHNLTAGITTQNEVNAISRLIYSDFVADRGRIPQQSDDDWAMYIRQRMDTDTKGRNTAMDVWQRPYRVREEEKIEGRQGYSVRSAGPDSTYNTGDDIVVERGYPRENW